MSEDKKKDAEKKDLTGILELASLSPPPQDAENADPFAVNDLPSIEQVDDFASIESLDMIDHEPEAEPFPSTETEVPPQIASGEPVLPAFDFNSDLDAAQPAHSGEMSPVLEHSEFDAAPPMDFLDELKNYSERSKQNSLEPQALSPFHLSMQGSFDPYSRDKLLLFINDNPMGINSSDLDLQLQAGRVLFPRISEFAGIKLIQELRDSGLTFKLTPSSRDEDEAINPAPALSYRYQAELGETKDSVIPVLPESGFDHHAWQVIDSIQMVQYLRAEILEVEKSELFQDLVSRMLEAMKRKARLKGADAMSALTHQLTPLRLPSQYQVELRANLLKKL